MSALVNAVTWGAAFLVVVLPSIWYGYDEYAVVERPNRAPLDDLPEDVAKDAPLEAAGVTDGEEDDDGKDDKPAKGDRDRDDEDDEEDDDDEEGDHGTDGKGRGKGRGK